MMIDIPGRQIPGFFNYTIIKMKRKLMETRFFAMLEENSKKDFNRDEYKDAIHEFVDEMFEFCDTEPDFTTIYRELEITRLCLERWMNNVSQDDEAGKKWTERAGVYRIRAGTCTDRMGVVT